MLCVGGRDAISVIGSAFLVLERPGARWALLAGLLRALAKFSPIPHLCSPCSFFPARMPPLLKDV